MSALILVLAIFPQLDEASPQSLDMGRPKLEKQTTSAVRKKKWGQNLNNKELENKKKEQNIIKTKPQNQTERKGKS